jgi:pimeloyl-ACP methyl ester carboxylesterase
VGGSLLLVKAAAGGVMAVAALAWLQNWLLYFPSRAPVVQMERGALRAWPSAQDFRGLVAEPEGAARATVIVWHGNAGHAGHRGFYAQALAPLGVRVILAEYPGYGPRDGQPGEAAFVADAEQTVGLALRMYGDAPLLLAGESLGAAVAAAAAARRPEQAAALLLITPWDKLEHVASHHYPWLPVRRLIVDRYDSVSHLAAFYKPVLVAVAEHDHIVPAQFGSALHAALPGPKRLVTLTGAGHNDWPDRVHADWWRDALAFLLPPR